MSTFFFSLALPCPLPSPLSLDQLLSTQPLACMTRKLSSESLQFLPDDCGSFQTSSDQFVVSSREHITESLSNVSLNWALCGRPIVLSLQKPQNFQDAQEGQSLPGTHRHALPEDTRWPGTPCLSQSNWQTLKTIASSQPPSGSHSRFWFPSYAISWNSTCI